ncbi:acetylxylan esterase [Gracilimonas mengyeensis]|uniref:4-O-methyl-glucuronoyl methylesterase-like domain-containing protein n=1 Tax=Gracilimonas mengyeensis TaxID=1302730 RepID=A0A521B0F8_9BACT|nr:acetylxylan esterase [Gracilimonas mengyeensis]SMO40573.1 hypothetical protein SAMN06265219_101487 [Gracilimonas mengyeensis]
MKKLCCLLIFLTGLYGSVFAQFSQQARDSLNKLSREYHQAMMDKLGISELRHGPSGNPEAPNAANSKEANVREYTLPDPLVFEDGTKVDNAQDWQRREAEIRELFNREMYGRLPDNIPEVNWEIINEADTLEGDYPVTVKTLRGVIDNSSYPEIEVEIDFTLTVPQNAEKPVPAMIHFGWNWPEGFTPPRSGEGPTWKEQLLEQGWAYGELIPTSYQADNGAGLTEGIIGLTNKGERRDPEDWGTLRAWAWGASRTLDYLETDSNVDADRVGIEGLSRYGKAAIVAMAYEPRLAIGFIGSSGAGGTKILRRNLGEQVENLASSAEYHWFAGNFIKYAGPLTVDDLPVDAHQLIVICATRPVFISVGAPDVEGTWVDAKGMFLAGVHASPVYELLGAGGLPTDNFPPLGANLDEGEIAFRQHEGGHTTGPNWSYFIEYARSYFE